MPTEKTSKNLTILYLTDSVLDPFVAERCRRELIKASGGIEIVSVSQEPLDFGRNVCVGWIGRSAVSMDTQMQVGLEEVKTPFVSIAEHDCLYTPEHFNFFPPDETGFWYNDHCYLVQLRNVNHPQYDGMYSYFKKRRVQSQLTCGTESLKEATGKKLAILCDPVWREKYPKGRIGEPGTNHLERTWRIAKANNTLHLWEDIKAYITIYNARDWKSRLPNLDIRHGDNFTVQRRGYRRCWSLPYWGTFASVMNGT